MGAEELLAALQEFGLEAGRGEPEGAVLGKLVELCTWHRVPEAELADELIAFATRKNITVITADFLHSFEHEVLSKRPPKIRRQKENRHAGLRDIDSIQELLEVEEEEENLLDAYASPAKSSQKRAMTTPENPHPKRTLSSRSPHLLFSPNSFSPSATPSQKYGSRSNRGEVVTSFGPVQGTSWHGRGGSASGVRLFDSPAASLTKPYRFMFQRLTDVREVLCCKIEELGRALQDHYKIEDFGSLNVPAQTGPHSFRDYIGPDATVEPVTVLGHVGCDSSGKLNVKSVVLEGDLEHSSGGQVPVDLSELQEYSLFPGQVVVMEGLNCTGARLVASKLYEGLPLPFHRPAGQPADAEEQMVLVACGPYSTSDSIAYDPLLDLIDVINKDQPDVCLLLGPFLDVKHQQVENSQLTASFEDVFKRCLKMIVDGTSSAGSRLVFVPSLRDAHHDCIYPQPPFAGCDLAKEDKQRVLFVSDPCTLDVNGVIFGLTSVDLLLHMGAEEISSSSSVLDRFSRILKHVLTQRSYYPLYPPAEEMNIDYENFCQCAPLPVTPDVLITPSDLRYFIKDVLGCLCVNPGRLTKGQVGGTYGRLRVRPQFSKEQRKSPCMAAQVVRI